jgi:acyl carrier protein
MDYYGIAKELIFQTIDELNLQLLAEQHLEKSLETILVGRESKIDSMALVNFIVAIEEKLTDEFGISITLVSEQAMAQDESPFKTVGTTIDYIVMLLKEPGLG